MKKEKLLQRRRVRRQFSVRKNMHGTPERPRLSIQKSLQHIACQIIDDVAGKTLVSASTRDKGLRDSVKYGGNQEAASAIGKEIAARALKAGIQQVQFDRGPNRYHGRVAALADAAREAGLKL